MTLTLGRQPKTTKTLLRYIFTLTIHVYHRSALNVESMEELPQWTSCVPGAGRRRQLNRQHHRNLLMLDEDIPTVVPYIAELVDGKSV